MLLTSSVRPSVGRALSARVPGVDTPTVAEVKLPACRPVQNEKAAATTERQTHRESAASGHVLPSDRIYLIASLCHLIFHHRLSTTSLQSS